MTPSSPTVCRVSATTRPIASSSLAEIAATRERASTSSTGCATVARWATMRATAASMPRFTSTGLPPWPMALRPSRTIACASTVDVVVPSPTTSLVLTAASLRTCAPMFSNWSRR
jgi:hypothetical protein